MAIELIDVGLGEDMGCGHLRLDPGLPPYLLGELDDEQADAVRTAWAEGMAQLTGYLYQERYKDAQLAAELTLLELPNLLAMLDHAADRWPPERVVDLADSVERLVANLGRPQALARATRVREQAAGKLGQWSHARFYDRVGQHRSAAGTGRPARRVPGRHPPAAAMPRGRRSGVSRSGLRHRRWRIRLLGRVLRMGGAAEQALGPLAEAQTRFQRLADAGNAAAERMASVAITETGDCLQDLGRLDEAAEAYEEGIQTREQMNDRREVAVNSFQLGTVRMLQQRFGEALAIYAEARDTFQALGEPRRWPRPGTRSGWCMSKPASLNPPSRPIGNRWRSACGKTTSPDRQPAWDNWETSTDDGPPGGGGDVLPAGGRRVRRTPRLAQGREDRSNLAMVLIQLERYAEARQELQRAIQCKKPYGHAAEPWKTWGLLQDLERATGHAAAAQAAREQAIQTYLAYRRAGGYSQTTRAQLFTLVAQAIQQNAPAQARELLDQLAARPTPRPTSKP